MSDDRLRELAMRLGLETPGSFEALVRLIEAVKDGTDAKNRQQQAIRDLGWDQQQIPLAAELVTLAAERVEFNRIVGDQ